MTRQLDKIEKDLGQIVGAQDQQIYLLQQMLPLCGSDFSAFNLLDDRLRVIGGVAWPITEERARLMQLLNPIMGALLWSSPVGEALRFNPVSRGAIVDTERLRASQIYREVYEPLGMHFLGAYRYPARGDRFVAIGISSASRAFTRSDIRALEALCERFEGLIVQDLDPLGPVLAFAKEGDWRVELTSDLQPSTLSDIVVGLLAFFYGETERWLSERTLPPTLVSELRGQIDQVGATLIPVSGTRFCSFSKLRHGRRLNLVLEERREGGFWLTCVEDSSVAASMQRLSDHCSQLRRDSYAVYRVCVALLDGARGEEAILEASSLAGLKDSSARRIISRAKSTLYELGLHQA